MTAPPATPSSIDSSPPRRLRARLRDALAALWVAVTGLAPHVLHHVGPLAGAAFVSGALGTSLFAIVGFVVTIPLLLRLRRRFGSWKVPAVALALFAAIFVISNTVVGSLVAAGDEVGRPPVTDEEHQDHHA